MPLWGPIRFWPGSGLVLSCLGPGFTSGSRSWVKAYYILNALNACTRTRTYSECAECAGCVHPHTFSPRPRLMVMDCLPVRPSLTVDCVSRTCMVCVCVWGGVKVCEGGGRVNWSRCECVCWGGGGQGRVGVR